MRRLPLSIAAATCLASALVAGPAASCINTFSPRLLEAHDRGEAEVLTAAMADAEEAHRRSPTLETTNDLAVARILGGRMDEGIEILRTLENARPGSAIVAGNLGTALGYSGRADEALTWIRESVRRDPSIHQGSEWVHVKFLEARLALQRDPDWLRRNSVIGWREGQRLPPNERSQPRTHRELVEAIGYQLDRHTKFIAPPDAVIGDLYLTLGDLAHSAPQAFSGTWDRDLREAQSYEAALRYGTLYEARARERLAAAQRRVAAANEARDITAQREQEIQAREQANQQAAEERRRRLESEQHRRRVMAGVAFGVFGLLVAGVILWRRRRAAA